MGVAGRKAGVKRAEHKRWETLANPIKWSLSRIDPRQNAM